MATAHVDHIGPGAVCQRSPAHRRLSNQTSGVTAYSYGNALVRKDGEFPLFDGQGSERTAPDSSQAVTFTMNYTPFGQKLGGTGSSASSYKWAGTSGYRTDGDGMSADL